MTGLFHGCRRKGVALRNRIAIIVWILATAAVAASEEPRVAEDVYRGEMVSYPGPWAFSIPKPGIVLVSDAELETLAAAPKRPPISALWRVRSIWLAFAKSAWQPRTGARERS